MTKDKHCIVVGDFNSHSPSWGYPEQDARGEEVEDWQTDMNLLLLNDPDDPPTYYSRSWMTTSTPDLAFATEEIALKTTREVDKQLGGSDHKPIILTVDMCHKREQQPTFTRWNYKKANWDLFATLTDQLAVKLNARSHKVDKVAKELTQHILNAAKRAIPRGARKNYRPYWTDELEQLEAEVTEARRQAECQPDMCNNIKLKEQTAKLRRETILTQKGMARKNSQS